MERCTPPPTTLQHPPRYPWGGGYTLLRRLRYALETFAYNEEYDETEREEHERNYDLHFYILAVEHPPKLLPLRLELHRVVLHLVALLEHVLELLPPLQYLVDVRGHYVLDVIDLALNLLQLPVRRASVEALHGCLHCCREGRREARHTCTASGELLHRVGFKEFRFDLVYEGHCCVR